MSLLLAATLAGTPSAIATAGFTEVHPPSEIGHLFPTGLVLGSVSAAAYAVGTIEEHVIGGQLSGTVWRRRMQQEIDQRVGQSMVSGLGRQRRR